jgi:hypothetical protein
MAKEVKGEWKHRVVDEVAVEGTSVVWRAQQSIAPDGKKFVGIRKFAIKKDGTEQVTPTGISVAYDPKGAHKKEIEGVIRLLESLI